MLPTNKLTLTNRIKLGCIIQMRQIFHSLTFTVCVYLADISCFVNYFWGLKFSQTSCRFSFCPQGHPLQPGDVTKKSQLPCYQLRSFHSNPKKGGNCTKPHWLWDKTRHSFEDTQHIFKATFVVVRSLWMLNSKRHFCLRL